MRHVSLGFTGRRSGPPLAPSRCAAHRVAGRPLPACLGRVPFHPNLVEVARFGRLVPCGPALALPSAVAIRPRPAERPERMTAFGFVGQTPEQPTWAQWRLLSIDACCRAADGPSGRSEYMPNSRRLRRIRLPQCRFALLVLPRAYLGCALPEAPVPASRGPKVARAAPLGRERSRPLAPLPLPGTRNRDRAHALEQSREAERLSLHRPEPLALDHPARSD